MIVFIFAPIAHAENGFKESKVENVRIHDTELNNWEPPIFWFTLETITDAGTCKLWSGKVLFIGNSDQMLSAVLAAQMAGRQIQVRYDDTKLSNGYCKPEHITVLSK